MLPTVSPLTSSQRAGYVLSLLCISSGWLILLLCILEWPGMQWSRTALGLQAAAMLMALRLTAQGRDPRLVIYPLVLAASTYVWDTTLPPPTLPNGWPRALIPGGVLVGLLLDYTWTMRHARHRRRQATEPAAPVRPAAEPLHGQSLADERRPISQRSAAPSGAEAQPAAGAPAARSAVSHRSKLRWWQLYLWVSVMSGLLLGVGPHVIPPAWQTVAQVGWCLLTLGGMAGWVHVNRSALLLEDHAKHHRRRRPESPPAERTIPLTPVQRHFLDVTERHERP